MLLSFGVVLVFVAVLVTSPVSGAEGGNASFITVLYPGWNLIGWVADATPVDSLFNEIEELDRVSDRDSASGDWQSTARGEDRVDSETRILRPGRAYWLYLNGEQSVEWIRARGTYSNNMQLRSGTNFVAWRALDSVPAAVGMRQIRNSAVMAGTWDAATQKWRLAPVSLAFSYWSLNEFNHGDGVWIRTTTDIVWHQLTGESPSVTFVGSVSEQQRADTLAELEAYREMFAATFGGVVSGARIVVFSDTNANMAWSQEVFGSGRTREACGSVRAWETYYTISCDKSVLAHEYFHVLQHAAERLAGTTLPPDWIVEGGAMYAPLLAVSETTGSETSELIEDTLRAAQADGRGLSIAAAHTFDHHQYQTAAAAIHLLMQTNGSKRLLQYDRRLSAAPPGRHYRACGGDPYSRAMFEKLFGISIPNLKSLIKSASPRYEPPHTLAASLQTQEPPLRLQLQILSPDGSRYNSAATMCLTAPDTGSQFAELAIAGSLSIPVESGRYEVQAIELGGGCHVGFDALQILVEDRIDDSLATVKLHATGCRAVVSGTVLGRDGRPLQPYSRGVWIELYPESAEDIHWSRRTQVAPDALGKFQTSIAPERYSIAVSPIESGNPIFGWVTNNGISLDREDRAILDLTTDLEQQVTIRLPFSRTIRIAGVVYDSSGHPAENLTVTAEGTGSGYLRRSNDGMSRGYIGWSQRTDSSGRFDMPFAGEDANVLLRTETDCHLGWFGPEGFTTDLSQIAFWETRDRDIRGLRIELPRSACD